MFLDVRTNMTPVAPSGLLPVFAESLPQSNSKDPRWANVTLSQKRVSQRPLSRLKHGVWVVELPVEWPGEFGVLFQIEILTRT